MTELAFAKNEHLGEILPLIINWCGWYGDSINAAVVAAHRP